jgi:uncharacterized protein (DUF1697 family)
VSRYLALLRGINVGGKNPIKMSALTACLEGHGFENVTTFIQSGNVLFDSTASGPKLVTEIEELLSTAFAYRASIVLRSRRQMQQIVERAPDGFGRQPARYRYNVLFVKAPLKAVVARKSVSARAGVDRVVTGPGVLYVSQLRSRASQSQLSRIVWSPIYPQLTIRNWNTTRKLLELMED